MITTSTLRTVALVAGCLDRRIPLADLHSTTGGPTWRFAGRVDPGHICTRPVTGHDRGPVTFGRTRPDGVVWLFDTLVGAHLLLRPSTRGTWQLACSARGPRGSVHTAPGVVAVHLGPTGTATEDPEVTASVFTLVGRPASVSPPVIPATAVRRHREALARVPSPVPVAV